MSWSPQQDAALRAASRWARSSGGPQVFRLFGYAGTGKTTLAKELADGRGKVLFGAFTGKAALMLQTKGCHGASTIHSMIYKPADDDGEDKDAGDEPRFRLNPDSSVADADLVIIDECSMVDEELGRDLLSFGVKVLVLGDPAQLPPVKGSGFFTNADPDVMLTEVHRQARDNPIIRMSMDVREGKGLRGASTGEVQVMPRSDITPERILAAGQVLVGMNKTRRTYNDRIRVLKGYGSKLPVKGDRLVCLKNRREKGLLNGGIWSAVAVETEKDGSVSMVLRPEDAGSTHARPTVHVHPFFFEGREAELEWYDRRRFDEFTFGYALTVHKAQGSQWDDVVLFDESAAFREDRDRWLYTGITRAAKTLTVVRSGK